MSSGKLIKQRRKSTKNIFKITRTMELVATAKLKIATRSFNNFLVYRNKIIEIISRVIGANQSHPLLQKYEPVQNIILIGLASNKGLCGNYNSKITNFILDTQQKLIAEGKNVALHIVGNKVVRHLQFNNISVAHTYKNLRDQPKFEELDPLAKQLTESFLNNTVQEVWLAYTKRTKLVCERLLPFSIPTSDSFSASEQYTFDPDAGKIMQSLIPMTLRLTLYQAFLDAAISEQTSRMLAMKTASENAEKIIKQLTREYNRARQSQITKEILEVLAGAERK